MVPVRDEVKLSIISKKSEKEFVHKLEATMPGSPSPVTIFEVICKK